MQPVQARARGQPHLEAAVRQGDVRGSRPAGVAVVDQHRRRDGRVRRPVAEGVRGPELGGQDLGVGQPDGAHLRLQPRRAAAGEIGVEAEAHGHGLVREVGDLQLQGHAAGIGVGDLAREIAPRPCPRRLAQLQHHAVRRGLGDRPGAQPAVAVQGAGVAGHVGRQGDLSALPDEPAVGDAVGVGDQGEAREIERTCGSRRRRAQHIHAAEAKEGHSAPNLGIHAELVIPCGDGGHVSQTTVRVAGFSTALLGPENRVKSPGSTTRTISAL